jgi:capsular exopolysaccharide synthesis family protein
MSTFFKALERAEQERALHGPSAETASVSTPAPEASEVAAAPVAPSAPERLGVVPPPTVPQSAPVSVPQPATQPTPVSKSVFSEPPTAARLVKELDERSDGLEEHLVSLLAPSSFEAEQYRALRHMIEQLHKSSDLSIIAVSSPDAADGKTTTAVNLAGTLAQAHDTRILLIDGDLRGANLAGQLGLDERGTPGLVDAILDRHLTLASVTQVHPHLNLSVITAGRRPSAPYEVLKAPRVAELFAEARAKYDYVIVDTSPLVSVPDSRLLGKLVDGFLIVVAAHKTPRKLLEEALNLLEASKIVGMVFNGDDHHVSKSVYSSRRRNMVRVRFGRQTASD